MESPEVANGVVEIKHIAREAGSRSKIAVASNDDKVDPIGACVGGRGTRVSAVMNELAGEKLILLNGRKHRQHSSEVLSRRRKS